MGRNGCKNTVDTFTGGQCGLMGCSTSKAATTAAMRMLEYEQLASSEDSGLKLVPSSLDTEEWRDGLIRHTAASLDTYLYNLLIYIIIRNSIQKKLMHLSC